MCNLNHYSPLPLTIPGKTKTKFSTFNILCPIFPYHLLSTKDFQNFYIIFQIPKMEEVGEN